MFAALIVYCMGCDFSREVSDSHEAEDCIKQHEKRHESETGHSCYAVPR